MNTSYKNTADKAKKQENKTQPEDSPLAIG
jgi:hypothetical protein